MAIGERILALRRELEPRGCRLIAVSKTQPVERIMEAYAAGQRGFGENKVQELVKKHEAMPKDIEWHMIGHLQTNKVKLLAPVVALVHSVDSVGLLAEISKHGEKVGRVVPCLLQVHIAAEKEKFGFEEPEVIDLLTSGTMTRFPFLRIEGLMGMATRTQEPGQLQQEFRRLRGLREALRATKLPDHVSMKELSMGMSDDYAIALEEGSTMVRIGTGIFGTRPPRDDLSNI